METTALYAGSFDPVTKGHEHIARRAAKLFGKLLIAVGDNSGKQPFFPLEHRLARLRETFRDVENIEVVSYQGLTVDACRRYGTNVLVRGLRSSADWEAESAVAASSQQMASTSFCAGSAAQSSNCFRTNGEDRWLSTNSHSTSRKSPNSSFGA